MNAGRTQTGLGGSDAKTPSAIAPRGRSAILFGVGLTIAAALTAVSLFFSVSGVGPIAPASPVMFWLLGVSLIITAFLTGVVVLQIVRIAGARSTPETGARLHLRFVSLFSFAAVAPAVIVAIFLGVTLSRGLEQWFSQRFKSVVENAAMVGKSYIGASTESVRGEVLAMATDLNRAKEGLATDKKAYTDYLHNQAQLRFFPSAYVINGKGQVLAAAELQDPPPYAPPSDQAFADARTGSVAMKFAQKDTVRALYRLKAYDDAYLYVARFLQPGLLDKLRTFDQSVTDYRDAESQSGRLQTLFALSYLTTAWLVLLVAVWLGLSNATRIVEPIGKLAEAAERVADGDLDARVPATEQRDEVDALGRAFNRMTGQLQAQRNDLIKARQDAEQRSGFIQAVLSGVSAGVIGLDRAARITAANRSASELLGVANDALIGRRLVDAAPELAEAISGGADAAPKRVEFVRDGVSMHLSVRVGADPAGAGLVLTFDDMTKLIVAQRQEAWKDVARRIAHEIKNPLTPIQLSAERLQRKYGAEIASDPETFQRCVDTILRQVHDIRRMVDEFSAFARMPIPIMGEQDLSQIVRETAFAQRLAFADIRFDVQAPETPLHVVCDGRLISQALTNIIKNAAEAIATRRTREGDIKDAQITVILTDQGDDARIEVIDNGVGFTGDRASLVEPYVTTRAKGTGLGLAIVRRVIEDHGGALELDDAPALPGALVRLVLPKHPVANNSAPVMANAEKS